MIDSVMLKLESFRDRLEFINNESQNDFKNLESKLIIKKEVIKNSITSLNN